MQLRIRPLAYHRLDGTVRTACREADTLHTRSADTRIRTRVYCRVEFSWPGLDEIRKEVEYVGTSGQENF